MAARPQGVAGTRDNVPEQQSGTDPLLTYCPDLDRWPRSWSYEPRDVPPGVLMVEYFKPFLRDILTLGLSRTTLRRHRDNIWVLGGEVIRRLQIDSRLRRRPVEQVVLDLIGEDGGPLLSHHESEAEQRAFDATCRKLFFLTEPRSAAVTSSEPTALLKGTIADRPATSVTVKPHSRAAVRRRRRA